MRVVHSAERKWLFKAKMVANLWRSSLFWDDACDRRLTRVLNLQNCWCTFCRHISARVGSQLELSYRPSGCCTTHRWRESHRGAWVLNLTIPILRFKTVRSLVNSCDSHASVVHRRGRLLCPQRVPQTTYKTSMWKVQKFRIRTELIWVQALALFYARQIGKRLADWLSHPVRQAK